MKECKISISKRMQYCIIFFFLLKPDYFSFLGIFTILYNYTFLIILFCVLINEIRKLQIRKISLLLYAITLFPLAVSLIQGVQLTQSAFFPILQTIGLIAVIGDGVEKKSISVLAGLALILEIYTYVNFATIVLFPDGLYDAALYAGNYWFLGYKNVMIRFLLPAIVLNAIWTVHNKGKYTVRLYLLIIISIATEWMVDCKTGLIGIIIVVATMIIFTRKQLPKFINARNGLLFIGVLSIALATTSLLDEFSDLLLDMGETVSVFSRQAVWFRAIQLFVKSPVWGYGIRTNDGYRELINLSTGWGYFSHPHNYILYVLIQGGILELMLISYLIIKVTRMCLANRNNYMAKMLLVFYIASFVMGITESLVGYTLLFPIVLYVGLLYEEEDYESISGRT